MRRPSLKRAFRVAIVVLLLEIVHKLATLQHLMEQQDNSNRLDRLMDWSPHSEESSQKTYVIPKRLPTTENNRHVDKKTTQHNVAMKTTKTARPSNVDTGFHSDLTTTTSTTMTTRSLDVCRIPPSEGPEGRMGFQALTKIQIIDDQSPPRPNTLRLLCIVVTDSTHHATTLPAILDTYGSNCDGFLAASNATDPSVHAVNLLSGSANESERLQRIWNYVREYGDDSKKKRNGSSSSFFDAFHFGVESSVVIPSNLRRMLSTHYGSQFTNPEKPMYLGGAVVASRKNPQIRHCGGQAGYTLNRAALQLSEHLSECSIPKKDDDDDPPFHDVDQLLAHCLREIADLQCIKTVDEDSALRYIEFGLDYQARFTTKTKKKFHVQRTPIKVKPLAEYHGIYIRDGLQGIASDAVAFSLVNFRGNHNNSTTNNNNNNNLIRDEEGFTLADAIRRVDAILKRTCKAVWDDPPVVALDVNGTSGYVHDPTSLRRHPPTLTLFPRGDSYGVCQVSLGGGDRETEAEFQGLQRIRIMNNDKKVGGEGRKKVLCIIYTHSGRHTSHLRPIAETYGPHCDGFLAASNQTDPSIGAVNLLHEGPEAYENMWLKVRSMWKYAYQHYLNDYDLFHIGGDDHYLIPENLVYMADVGSWRGPWKFSEPLFLGGSMVDFPMTNIRYCGGGSGYTLNRVALKLLIEELFHTYHCRPHYHASDEDRIVSDCFRSAGISCMDTNDQHNETRYHQASVDFHASWTRDQAAVWHAGPLERVHGIASKEGLGQISQSSVSFHLKEIPKGGVQEGMRRYHAILHGLCNGTAGLTSFSKAT